uniref:Prenyltransferase SptD n=1 Tax=Aspergillus sp. TaxID=5065 RepID=A0A6J4CU88_9EURO|nr:prenyltransferase SptD [Aspergillus sp.]
MSATTTEAKQTFLCKERLPRRYHPPSKVLSRLPTSFLPYGELLRLHKPLGYILVCYPFLVAGAFSASIAPEVLEADFWPRITLLCLWSIFLRSGGCIWDDIADQHVDAKVARTRLRPLPRGAVSNSQATIFAAGTFLCGFAFVAELPGVCMVDALIMLFFAVLYPYGKRHSNYPQLILGTIGWAIPMTMHGLNLRPLDHPIPMAAMFAFIALVTIMNDIIYARQDIEEDIKAGVGSMAVRFQHCLDALTFALVFASSAALVIAGKLGNMGAPFFTISVGGHFGFFLFLAIANQRDPKSGVEWAAKRCCTSATFLLIVGMVVDLVWRS